MRLVRLALSNPYAVIVLCLTIIIIGLTTLGRIPVDILPQFKTPAVQILTLYPGMPADIVERDITNRIERWTGQANGVSRQESRSLTGVSIVKDYFRSDIDPNTAMSQVSSLATSDLYYLPPGTIPPMVMPFDPTASQPLALLALSSDTLDETSLYDIAYFQVRNLLSGTPGVIAPAVFGGKLRRILIYVDKDKLAARGMSPMDVVNAIRKQNVFIPTGDAKIGNFDYQIVTNAMVPKVSDLNNIPIKYVNGKWIFVKDVGKASDSYAIQTNIVHINGKRAVYIPIYRQPGANTIQVVNGIKAALHSIQQRVTNGRQIKMSVIIDQSIYVRQAIGSLEREGFLGAILAVVMILVFLGSVRSTLIIAISLPLSILTAFIALYFTGETINAMTLGGLALSVGILMDNGIVVIENTFRHLEMGKSALQAARDGALEVAKPVLVATLSICIVFAPVIFLTGIGKFLFTPLSMAVIFALLASYLLSMLIVPAACARFLKANPFPSHRKSLFERGFEALQRGYSILLSAAMLYRVPTLAGIAIAFGLSLFILPHLGQELFPQVDSGQFMVLVRAPSGTRIEKTEEITRQVEDVVKHTIPPSDLKMVVSNMGLLYDWPAAYTPNAGVQDSFVLVQLKGNHSKTPQEYADLLRSSLPQKVPGAQFAFDTGGLVSSALNFGLPSPIDIQVKGASLKKAHQIAQVIQKRVAHIQGAVDVRIQQKLDYPEISLDVHRTEAAAMGLNADNVVKNVVTALNSSISFMPSFWIDHKNGNHYFVGVSYREKDINSRQSIENIPITGAEQKTPIPLRNMVTMKTGKAPVEISHYDIARVTDIYANVQGRDIGSVSHSVQDLLKRLQLPEGYTVKLRGEFSSMQQSFTSLGFGLALAIVLVYLLMVVQFRSFVDPFIVMFAVPPGLIGVLLMLWLTRTTINIQSLLGTIMVVGLTVSYSVLIVEFANQRLEAGIAPREAVMEAVHIRLRPILMTSLATILGLLPMAVSSGEANMPLARAVIGGLLVSTIVKLFLLPILYSYLKRSTPAMEGNLNEGK